jgi:hypothetical protein
VEFAEVMSQPMRRNIQHFVVWRVAITRSSAGQISSMPRVGLSLSCWIVLPAIFHGEISIARPKLPHRAWSDLLPSQCGRSLGS